ncbi:Ubiquitin system component Cue [Penicillium chermesinum]|uniref:Ubiquitin system component Cue n=1 Tax=Penicillium chermesinum TaxID=63820 RepID=A0A9W9PMT0_9EURO|nr:Ubiquitin system component Cue [Penicillium chermesinum]KAJ5248724.1 Ubiquitin system component Cue [Penicillium chermesinum]
MADEEKQTTPIKPPLVPNSPRAGAESPTTARPLDFNDEDEPQESGVTTASPSEPQQTATETPATAPPKPPRPLGPREHAENTLKEAFPSVDASVVKAVLVASNWNVERAFNALLGMTDPTAQEDMVPPPKPPRPSQPATSTTRSQLEADELYARQLAERYNSDGRRRAPAPGWENDPRYHRPRGGEEEEKEYNFFDDDLPKIQENLRKGFLETQSKVNSWMTNFKKKFDGEEEEEEPSQQYQRPPAYGQPRRSGDLGRRSGDRERYDADPQVLGDDFSALELRDSEAPPPRPPRPGQSSLKKATSPSPDRRKVSFQEGPPTEIDNAGVETKKSPPPNGGKSSKWQPLATVDPSPVADNDPFSLGDSDDEKETKPKEQTTEGEQSKPATEKKDEQASK